MELKELVAPWELCKLIPEGEFKDSAFIYMEVIASRTHTKTWSLLQRTPYEENRPNPRYPAPTLEEIMEKLRQDYIKVGTFVGDVWGCYVINNFGDEIAELDKNSPGTAALKLWLKVKGIEYGKDNIR